MCGEVIRCELGAQCGPGGAHTSVLHSQQVWASAAFQGAVYVNLGFQGSGGTQGPWPYLGSPNRARVASF